MALATILERGTDGRQRKEHLDMLTVAEMQYKLSLGVLTACNSSDDLTFDYYEQFTWGGQSATREELALTKEQERFAAAAFEHTATYLMVVQIDTALKATVPDHLNHPDDDIRSASLIAWLLRNAFAHNPFAPTWKVYGQYDNQTYAVKDVIVLKTTGLNGQLLKRRHYGGPLALLRLLQFTKRLIEEQPRRRGTTP
jgi:hypothetical protein